MDVTLSRFMYAATSGTSIRLWNPPNCLDTIGYQKDSCHFIPHFKT